MHTRAKSWKKILEEQILARKVAREEARAERQANPPVPPELLKARQRPTNGGPVRSATLNRRYLTPQEKAHAAEFPYPDDADRPMKRSECRGGHRPCPFVSCAHHLYLDENETTG